MSIYIPYDVFKPDNGVVNILWSQKVNQLAAYLWNYPFVLVPQDTHCLLDSS